MTTSVETKLKTLTLKTELLAEAIGFVKSAISNINAQDIYKYIRMVIESNKVYIVGGNSTISKKITIPKVDDNFSFDLDEDADFCVLGDTMYQLVRSAKSEYTELKLDGSQLSFKAGGIKAKLPMVEGHNYPSAPFDEGTNSINLPYADLIYLYKQTHPIVSKEITRPTLTGVNHVLVSDKLSCYSTNGKGGARASVDISDSIVDASEDANFTVPDQTIKEIIGLKLKDENDSVNLRFTEGGIVYSYEERQIYSTLIEGAFPDVSKLVKGEAFDNGTSFIINKGTILTAMNISSIYNERPVVFLIYDPVNGYLRLESDTSKGDKVTGGFKYDIYSEEANTDYGEVTYLALHAAELKKVLAPYSASDELILNISGQLLPLRIKLSWEDGNDGHVLAPVRTDRVPDLTFEGFSPEPLEEDDEDEE